MAISGYIIEAYNCMGSAYTCRRLAEEAVALGMDVRLVGVHDTRIHNGRLYNGDDVLEMRDFAICRYKWGKICAMMRGLVNRCYNPAEAFDCYVNKYEQVSRLSSQGFSLPDYVLGTALQDYEKLIAVLGTPFVAKGLESSMGREIRLIRSREDYAALLSEWPREKEWLFEQMIGTSIGRDLRLFALRGKAVACMQRESGGDFRANVALGAKVSNVAISPVMAQIAEDIYAQTGLDFVGIDLLFGENGFYLCEINVMPGLEGIEQASGINIAGKIMEMIRDDFGE